MSELYVKPWGLTGLPDGTRIASVTTQQAMLEIIELTGTPLEQDIDQWGHCLSVWRASNRLSVDDGCCRC